MNHLCQKHTNSTRRRRGSYGGGRKGGLGGIPAAAPLSGEGRKEERLQPEADYLLPQRGRERDHDATPLRGAKEGASDRYRAEVASR